MASRKPPQNYNARPGNRRGHFVLGASRVRPVASGGVRHGLARVLSKAGLCSRSEAARRVQDGRVSVDGRIIRDPEFPIIQGVHRILADGQPLSSARRIYLALNKPRGLVTTVKDEQGRETVYRCFDGAGLPWLAPAGRLDKASEGLLLFSNDPEWAARLTDPLTGPLKTYRVQIDGIPHADQLAKMHHGVDDAGEHLAAYSVTVLRQNGRTAWLEIVLDEGRNRHIRRLLQVLGWEVLRLVRVAIGPVQLGELGKGQWRELAPEELNALAGGKSHVVQGDSVFSSNNSVK